MIISKSLGFPTTLEEDPQVRMKLENMPVPLDLEDVDRFMGPTLRAAYEGDFGLVPELRK